MTVAWSNQNVVNMAGQDAIKGDIQTIRMDNVPFPAAPGNLNRNHALPTGYLIVGIRFLRVNSGVTYIYPDDQTQIRFSGSTFNLATTAIGINTGINTLYIDYVLPDD